MSVRLSYSSISSYEKCPLEYRLRYVDKLETPRSAALVFGSIVHAALEKFHELVSKPVPSLEDLLSLLDDVWESEGFADPDEEEAHRQRARNILERYFESNRACVAETVALESRFSLDMGEVILSGVIDRIDRYPDGSYEIIDYKTNRNLPPLARLQDDIQLPIYQLASIEGLGIRPDKLTFYYLVPGQRYTTRPQPPEYLERLKSRIVGAASRITAAEFDPKPNHLCPWCDYKLHCPLEQTGELRVPSLVNSYADLLSRRRTLDERIARVEQELLSCSRESGKEVLESSENRTRVIRRDGMERLELFEDPDPDLGV